MDKRKLRTILRFIGLTDDIMAIPRLIWIGGGAVLVALGHIFKAIRNLPLGYQILFAVGVLLLWLALVLFVVKSRKRGNAPGTRNETQSSVKQKLLEQVFQDDYYNLYRAVQIKRIDWNMSEIKNDMPYIIAKIHIVNNAVFPITITGVEGNMMIRGQKCTQPITMSGRSNIDRFGEGNATIEQAFPSTLANQLIENYDKEGSPIKTHTCALLIQARDKEFQREPEKKQLITEYRYQMSAK